jgi:hypothetical protein
VNRQGPRVGAESDEYRAVCVYSEQPGEPKCGQPATTHVRVKDPHYGEVSLVTCARHLPIARAAGKFLQEHKYEGWCGFPASLWNIELNVCLMDDTGVEPVRREHAEAAR